MYLGAIMQGQKALQVTQLPCIEFKHKSVNKQYWSHCVTEPFSTVSKVTLCLLWLCFTMLSDWLKKLAPLS